MIPIIQIDIVLSFIEVAFFVGGAPDLCANEIFVDQFLCGFANTELKLANALGGLLPSDSVSLEVFGFGCGPLVYPF